MRRDDFDRELRRLVAPGDVAAHVPLAPLTTLRVGGPADWLVDVRTADALAAVARLCAAARVPLTPFGSGSNVIVADEGVRGVVVRLRLTAISEPASGVVRAEAGVTINGLVRWMIARGLAGLEAWAGTPGTVGGAVFGNAHWAHRNIGDLISGAFVLSPSTGAMTTINRDEMGFAYDTSRLQTTGEILVWLEMPVTAAAPDALRATARASLAYRKRTQPLALPSAGCIFQNPDPRRDALPEGVPASAGALIDRAGLKGHRLGGAMISTTHANFIVNDGTATAADVRALVETARAAVSRAFGVTLRDEVRYLGTVSNG